MRLDSIFKTHTGRVRQINQDYGLIQRIDDETKLVIVADGMGGHKAGEVASQMATEIIRTSVEENWNQMSWEELLIDAINKANTYIFSQAKENSEYEGMGTTIEVGLLSEDRGLIAHVGDSRVYLYQNSSLYQLTEDHSLVYALYKSGQISLDEVKNHPQKNWILRAVGTEEAIEIDLHPFTWEAGDRILFCSDGLYKHMTHEMIAQFLQGPTPISVIGDQLINSALELGGDDNITLILAEKTFTQAGGEGV